MTARQTYQSFIDANREALHVFFGNVLDNTLAGMFDGLPIPISKGFIKRHVFAKLEKETGINQNHLDGMADYMLAMFSDEALQTMLEMLLMGAPDALLEDELSARENVDDADTLVLGSG